MNKKLLLTAIAVLAYLGFCAALALGVPDARCAGDCAEPDSAIVVVPADALAYAHVDLDRDSDQLADAARIYSELPQISTELGRRLGGLLPAPSGEPPDFAADIAPWFGGEAAVALLPSTRARGEQVEVLEVSDPDGAAEFAADLAAAGPEQTIEVDGATITVDARGLASAQIAGFLVIGTEQGLRQVAATAAGAGEDDSLASDEAIDNAREALPGDRLADVFLSPDGIAALVDDERAPLATLAPFVAPSSSEGLFRDARRV